MWFAALVDTYERLGLDAVAQVDLGVRSHVHQDLASLGAMAAEVVAAAASRRFTDASPLDARISHVGRSSGGIADEWTTRPINLAERPPRASLNSDRGRTHIIEGAE